MRHVLVLIFGLQISIGFAQTREVNPASPRTIAETDLEFPTVSAKDENQKTKNHDQMPMFPGGNRAVSEYIESTIKYPESARQNKIKGRVLVSFNVSKTGKVEDVKLVKGIGGGCDEEAIRAVSNIPDWLPGLSNGKPVKVKYVMPVDFKY